MKGYNKRNIFGVIGYVATCLLILLKPLLTFLVMSDVSFSALDLVITMVLVLGNRYFYKLFKAKLGKKGETVVNSIVIVVIIVAIILHYLFF